MLIAYLCISKNSSMTDSMNFGPEWLRNLSSEGSTGGSGIRHQLADFRYGREEMLALFKKGLRAPMSLSSFNPLYSEQMLPPLALLPQADDERVWTGRTAPPGNVVRGRGTTSLDRGGRGGRGRGSYPNYNRGGYDSSGGWVPNESTTEWSPRKDYTRANSVDNWRRHRSGDDDEGWRNNNHVRIPTDKWGRSTSWRDGGDGSEDRGGSEKPNRASWQEGIRGSTHRRPWENEDHLPEWAMENSLEAGGTFDSSGAFHGCSDDEQKEHKPTKKDVPLQKSISQQNITVKSHPTTLPSSQSAVSLSKPPDDNVLDDIEQEPIVTDKIIEEKQSSPPNIEQTSKPTEYDASPPKIQNIHHKEQMDSKQHYHNSRMYINDSNTDLNGVHSPDSNNRVDEEFERSQEDFIKKLVVDEELPNKPIDRFMLPTVVPPPNLPPSTDTWFYQDPQGDLQGGFTPAEMAEWFRAGYFTSALLVRREQDEAFYRLGDLVTKCGGNPFQSNIRLAPLKKEVIPPVNDELLKYQLLQRQLLRQAETMRALSQNEGSWVMPQQRDLVAQQVLNHSQMTSDMQFFQQQQQPPPQPVTNPLMNMINQMQQANKLPSQMLGKKQTQLDPIHALVQQMGGLQPLQNSGPSASGLPTNIPTSLQNNGLLNNYSNLPAPLNSGSIPGGFTGLNNSGIHSASSVLSNSEALNNNGINIGLTSGFTDGNRLPPRPNPLGAVDSLATNESDPLKNLLQQLHNKQQTQQLDSLWQQNQFAATPPNTQWQSNEVPMSMWDLQSSSHTPSIPNTVALDKQPPPHLSQQPQKTNQNKNQEKERQRLLKENLEKEQKRQKELEEKQSKKDAEERRKEEQRRQEVEKKAAEEKRKKEDERIRKELEKSKKEAEEKRLRELEEKRRLKEQRKAEEELRRKSEEQKKVEETEKIKREAKEKEDQLRMKQMEAAVKQQEEREIFKATSRIVPWSNTSSTPELSLADIQKAEREKRSEQLLQQQRVQQAIQLQQVQNVLEKQAMQLSWNKKPAENKSIKSLVEIQQEEQERFAKQAVELRAALKEKEVIVPASIMPVTPWSGQGLSWANSNQWNNIGGFWDDAAIQMPSNKPMGLFKSNSATAVKQPIKQNKSKLKKEEQQVMKLFSNGPVTDEFTEWCTTTLTRLHSTVDIPTFINFLRDIESALEVKDYCKEYFGDVPATQQFVTQFLERRRMFKPKIVTQTDDMSSPAPALTPSSQHNTEFQEVKGKGKKTKKSKMIKVDARNLGFSVTAAPDRINVGDRDYVEN